ncbi:MAG: LysM peptidoglycan-binding domain-containing protein [Planctomycetota bacterium]
MRALLGLLLLGTLFVMAASWQKRTTKGRHEARARRFNISSEASFDESWSRLLVGRPSGGEPIVVPESELPPGGGTMAAPGRPPGADPTTGRRTTPLRRDPEPEPTPRIPADRVYVVKNGDVLGTICQRNYDVRPLHEVVRRVARYNDLASPDAIREGDELRLPDAQVLFPR